MTSEEIERLARVISHNVGEALLRKYGEFRPHEDGAAADYYSLIRNEVEEVLHCST